MKLFFAQKRWKAQGQREASGLQRLQTATIPTPELIYAGLTNIPNSFIVITDYLANARTLSQVIEFLPVVEQTPYLEKAVELTAQMHNHRLLQADLHLDNFLISEEKFFLIDGDRIQESSKKISEVKGKNNLALLFAQCVPYHEYWAGQLTNYYLEKRDFSLNKYASSLVTLLKAQVKLRQKSYLKKIFRDCTVFFCRKNWHWFAVQQRSWTPLELPKMIREFNQQLAVPESLLKKGQTATVGKIRIREEEYVLKRYNIKSFWHALSRCWRPSRAWRTWYNAHCLKFWNIATPKPIALIEKRWGWLRKEAYYLSVYAKGESLDHYFARTLGLNDEVANVISQVNDLFQSLYQAKLSHGDLKATNFLWVDKKLLLLDLDSMRQHRFSFTLQRAWRKDLKRFLANWSDIPWVQKEFGAINFCIDKGRVD